MIELFAPWWCFLNSLGGGGGMEQLEVGKTGFLKEDARKKEKKEKKSIRWVTTTTTAQDGFFKIL